MKINRRASNITEKLLEEFIRYDIDPITGDCLCFAAALQKLVDKNLFYTEIVCLNIEPGGEIGHCMLKDKTNDTYYDVYGKHDYLDAIDIFKDMIDEECYPDDKKRIPTSCLQVCNYKNNLLLKKICKKNKIGTIERILKNNPPSWILSLLKEQDPIKVSLDINKEETYDEMHAFHIKIGNFIVGYTLLRDDGYLEKIKILPQFRNMGIGKFAISLIEIEAKKLGCCMLYLLSVEHSRFFFEKMGFKEIRTEDSYYLMEKQI